MRPTVSAGRRSVADFESFWREDPSELLRVGSDFVLDEEQASHTPGFEGRKKDGRKALAEGGRIFSELQEMFFAASTAGDRRSILLVLQAMDTAGKGGIVRHVMGAADPAGIRYHAFKAP